MRWIVLAMPPCALVLMVVWPWIDGGPYPTSREGATPHPAPTRVYRDWQVENPLMAGIAKGITLTLVPAQDFGAGWREADIDDPYAVSPEVGDAMTKLARTPHLIGLGVGLTFWISIYFATAYRYLNKLKTVAKCSQRLATQ